MGCGRRIVYTVALIGALAAVEKVRAQALPPRAICVTGVIDGPGTQTVLDIFVAVPAGQDEQAATAAALKTAGARDPGPFDMPLVRQPFVVAGYMWPQFFDKSKLNNLVTQLYNPAGDPTGGKAVAPILNAEATWSAVRGSRFRYTYGGQTTSGDAYDRVNTIFWSTNPSLGDSTLGVTATRFNIITGEILDSDIQLSAAPGIPWRIDGTDFDVETVMLHEAGHALGLDHSPYPNSVMFASYQGVRRGLDVIDSDAVAFLYPAHTSNAGTPRPPSAPYQLVASLGDLAPGGLSSCLWSSSPGISTPAATRRSRRRWDFRFMARNKDSSLLPLMASPRSSGAH